MSKLFFVFLNIVFVSSCTRFSPTETHDSNSARMPSSQIISIGASEPGCLGMVKDFCETLYGPENQGSLRFSVEGAEFDIRHGYTENDFNEKEFELLTSQLTSWPKLPLDFRIALESRDFKRRLKAHLQRGSRQNLTLKERIRNLHREEEIKSIWNVSLTEAVLTRLERRYPGYSRIKDAFLPLELKYESQRQRRILFSEIAKALWKDHRNWKKVEKKYQKVLTMYRDFIQDSEELPADIKEDWLRRLKSLKLIIPGSDPEVEMESCALNEENAYYFREKNYITVCAGDFNTEDIEQTIAHEIGHALDVARSRFIFQDQSKLGVKLKKLKQMSCSARAFSCKEWADLKSTFNLSLMDFSNYQVQLKKFNSCLKRKKTVGIPSGDYVSRVAKEEVDEVLADLAERNVFIRVIGSKLPMPDGTARRNPMYLNPCGYYLWEEQGHPLSDDMSLLMFFTSEYRCSTESDNEMKFQNAIELAKHMQTQLVTAKIQIEGEFSARPRLDTDGYASSPAERFADVIGQKVFAKILESDSSVKRRRARYLANNAWLCRRPSIQQMFPNEAKIQKNYYVEPHSETSVRQKELLTREIQKVLQCKSDFETISCPLGPD